MLIFVIDLDSKIIPDILVFPALPVAFLLSSFVVNIGWRNSLLGGGIAFTLVLIPYFISYYIYRDGIVDESPELPENETRGEAPEQLRGGMGFGDVKLAALMGLALGFPSVLVALFMAIVSGGILASMLLLFKLRGRKWAMPFGPFLSAGTFVSFIWGQKLISFYLSILR